MSLAQTISRGLKATLLSRIVRAVANGLLMLLLARYLLGPDGYGLLYFALSTIGVITIFATLGLPKSTARYVNEYLETDPSQIPWILRRTLLYIGGLTVLVGAGLAISNEWLASFLDEPALASFLLVGIGYVFFRAINQYCLMVFQGFNRVDWSALLGIIENVARLVFTVGLVLMGYEALGAFAGYMLGYVVAVTFGLAGLYLYFYRTYDPAPTIEDGLSRRILEYSVPLTATRGANVLDKRIDTVLVGVILNATAVSFYTIARQVAEFAAVPVRSLGFTISPALGEQKAADETETAARLYEESFKHVTLLYVPGAVGLVLVADPLIRYVFGPDYAGVVPVLQVLSVFVVVNAINLITTDGLDYLGRARMRAIAKGTTAIANFVLNILLLPIVGVVGAAIATVVTFSTYTLVNVYVIHEELGFRVREIGRHAAIIGGISLTMGVAVFLSLPHVSGLLTLVGVILVGGAIWALLSVATGLIDVRQALAFLAERT